MTEKMNRRRFLHLSGLAMVGAVAVACAPTAPVEPVAPAEGEAPAPEGEEAAAPETGAVSGYKEAPELAAMVEAGELPPVDERLGPEPLVLARGGGFEQEIGVYGDDIVMGSSAGAAMHEYPLMLDRSATKTVPNFCSAWNVSDDGKTFTLYIRKGLKWSDGEPFTSEDFQFYWDAFILNKEITPVEPAFWKEGGSLPEVVSIDDTTIEYRFAAPNYYAMAAFDSTGYQGFQRRSFLPAHALKQFHIDYNPDAEALAKEAGFETWYEYFLNRAPDGAPPPEIPTMSAWMRVEEAPDYNTNMRNPYYFKVDPEGNQLPYINRMRQRIWEDPQAHTMQLLSGEVDFEGWGINIADFPVLKNGEEKGGYDVWWGGCVWPTYTLYHVNESYMADPELGDILRDKRFRQALSLSIDRQAISDKLFLGLAKPVAVTCNPSCPWFKEEWLTAYADFDTDRANTLLDEMGLDQRDAEGFRLKPSGEPLSIILEVSDPYQFWVSTTEMVTANWNDVGIRTTMSLVDSSLMWQHNSANEAHIVTWIIDNQMPPAVLGTKARNMWIHSWAPAYGQWLDSNGEGGVEPPDDVKELFDLTNQIRQTPPDQVIELLQRCYDDQAENVRMLGTVGDVGKPCLTKKALGNVDFEAFGDNSDMGGTRNNPTELFFWKE